MSRAAEHLAQVSGRGIHLRGSAPRAASSIGLTDNQRLDSTSKSASDGEIARKHHMALSTPGEKMLITTLNVSSAVSSKIDKGDCSGDQGEEKMAGRSVSDPSFCIQTPSLEEK